MRKHYRETVASAGAEAVLHLISDGLRRTGNTGPPEAAQALGHLAPCETFAHLE